MPKFKVGDIVKYGEGAQVLYRVIEVAVDEERSMEAVMVEGINMREFTIFMAPQLIKVDQTATCERCSRVFEGEGTDCGRCTRPVKLRFRCYGCGYRWQSHDIEPCPNCGKGGSKSDRLPLVGKE